VQVNYMNLFIAISSLIATAAAAKLLRKIYQEYIDVKNSNGIEAQIIKAVNKNTKSNIESDKLKEIEGR